MNLFINACARRESRTKRLADALMEKLGEPFEELRLCDMPLLPLSAERLAARAKLIESGNYDDPMFDAAKQFAAADRIVIAAPYWDGSFPSVLKVYLENIYVTGIVSRYSETGIPIGLCRATDLWYVTTAGGQYVPTFSYDYLSTLGKFCFGIGETHLVKAEYLDIAGNDAEALLRIATYGILNDTSVE